MVVLPDAEFPPERVLIQLVLPYVSHQTLEPV